jgi:anti-anti-sigma factor
MDGFSVHSEREGRLHRLTPVGALDLASAPGLEREFHAVHPDETVEMVVVDLTRLTFMDSSGLNLLARLNAWCEPTDRLRVINGSRAAEWIMDLSGMRDHLPIISRGDDALALLEPGPSRSRPS